MPQIVQAPTSARAFTFDQETIEQVIDLLAQAGPGQVVTIVDEPVPTEQRARLRIARMREELTARGIKVRGRVIVNRMETFSDMLDEKGKPVRDDDGNIRQSGNADGEYWPAVYVPQNGDTTPDESASDDDGGQD